MARIRSGDTVTLQTKELFGEYVKSKVKVVAVDAEGKVQIEGIGGWFIQGSDEWQQSNQWRDRFYHEPPNIGGMIFTRT